MTLKQNYGINALWNALKSTWALHPSLVALKYATHHTTHWSDPRCFMGQVPLLCLCEARLTGLPNYLSRSFPSHCCTHTYILLYTYIHSQRKGNAEWKNTFPILKRSKSQMTAFTKHTHSDGAGYKRICQHFFLLLECMLHISIQKAFKIYRKVGTLPLYSALSLLETCP